MTYIGVPSSKIVDNRCPLEYCSSDENQIISNISTVCCNFYSRMPSVNIQVRLPHRKLCKNIALVNVRKCPYG